MKLHLYQQQAVDHLHRNPRAALWLDMGLGKSAITLSALTPQHLPALILAPKRVVEEVWPVEQPLWRPDLTMVLANGSPAQRDRALLFPADICVLGRDVAADALSPAILSRFETLVLDESSGYKARTSTRFKVAKKMVPGMPHVWELTGTPSPNGYMDLWSQMFLLDGGKRLGKTITAYRERYFRPGRQLPNGVITEWLLRDGCDSVINALLEDIVLSMDADGRLDLPPVTHNRVRVPLRPAVRKVYKAMEKKMVVGLDLLGEVHTAAGAGVLSGKLSQISAGFLYSEEQDGLFEVIHTDNVAALEEIVHGTGSPVLVFYRYKAELAMFKEAMPGLLHTMDEPGVVAAWNRGEVPVLAAHPASAGHGLNLQKGPGHTIVWATSPWSLEEWMQGNGRLARQGQQHPVVVHYLVSPDTVDEAIQDRLHHKKSVQQALLDYVACVL